MKSEKSKIGDLKFLAGGGEMGKRIGAFNWSQSPLGSIGNWPQSLKTSVSLILNTTHPMWIGWGRDVTFLYNDAYIGVLSMAKHPQALGKPCSEVWAEIWDICGPLVEKVFQNGESSFRNDVRFLMNRGDFVEEKFYSFSYSPIRDESGNVGGLFCPTTDVTPKVLNTRRLHTLSELAAKSLVEKSTKNACASAAAILAKNPDDIPFAMLYLIEPEGKLARLEQSTGIEEGLHSICPTVLELTGPHDSGGLWPASQVFATPQLHLVSVRGIEGFPLGLAAQRVSDAVVVPVVSGGQEQPLAILIAGVNPARKLDADYRTFYELVAGHIGTAVANARSAEEQKKQAEMLAEIDRAKTAFFSNVSHEFRTPLTLMLGPLEDLLARKKETTELGDIAELEVIHRNSLRLLKLVNTLLDFSRIEAGRMRALYVETDLAALTTDLSSVFRSAMERAGLEFTVDCGPLPHSVFVDRDMWEKIVFNLLSNAFKFTLEGSVEISLCEENRMAALRVRDTGIGIPADELPNVFKRFHRIENARGRSHEGTGIGLALASELVKLHGGSIDVASEPGRGTVFEVKIPFGNRHLAPESIGLAATAAPGKLQGRVFLEEASSWLPHQPSAIFDHNHSPAKEGGAKDDRDPTRPRILLAEDNADLRDYICRLLSPRYEVELAADGAIALESARKNPPKLVLSDVMMPRLDGLGLLQGLRNDAATRDIPVILLSARAGEDAVMEGVEIGADDYLTKPFSARELQTRVAAHLKMDRMRKESAEKIRQSEAKYRNLFNTLLEGFCIIEMIFDGNGKPVDYRFLEINPAFEQQTGLREAQGKLVRELVPGHEAHWFEIYGKIALTGEPAQFENEAKALNRWYKVSAFRVGGVESRKVAVLFYDITSNKQAEAALRQNEALFSALVNQAPTGLYVVDAQFRLQQVNALAMPAFEKVHPRIGRDFAEVMHILWGPAVGGEIVKIFRHTLATGEPYNSPRFSEFRQDLGLEKTYEWQTQRVTLPDGQHGVVCYFNDITERAENEARERKLNALLADRSAHLETLVQQRTAKLLETIGELEAFSYSIAHDMRAPLRSLQGFSNILLADYGSKLEPDCLRFLQLIAASASRMDKLILDVLNYSRVVRGEYPLAATDPAQLLRGIIDTYPNLGPDKAEITLRGPFPPVLANEAMLTQILSNLLGNAAKFVLPGTKPSIKVWAEPQGHCVRLFVQDNGIGIAADHQERIFGIFQRVDKSFEGTGIGLAIVKKAVERLGGKVGVQSEPGRGSTFWVEVPQAGS
jgi:PAS domain S-box-containing protein